MSELLLPLQAGERVVQVTAASFHSAALTDRGRLLMWGDNSYGQCGTEASNASAVGDSEMSCPLGPERAFFGKVVALGE